MEISFECLLSDDEDSDEDTEDFIKKGSVFALYIRIYLHLSISIPSCKNYFYLLKTGIDCLLFPILIYEQA